MRSLALLGAIAAAATLFVACGSGSGAATVDVEVSGTGVDEAIIEIRGESMTVELPWSTTVTVEDEPGTDAFTVIATNPTEVGELRCDAEWNQAAEDGTWSRSASYQVSCGGRVSFDDTGIVRLEPTGRRITFEEHAAELAEAAAALAAEQAELESQDEQDAKVTAARALAASPGTPVRVGDWEIAATGVLRDATEYIESTTNTVIRGRDVPIIAEISATYRGNDVGQARDLAFQLIGGLSLERYQTFDVSCGVIPNPAHDTGEPTSGERVVFNVCWEVDATEMKRAFLEVDQFGIGVDAEPVQLLLPDVDSLPGSVAEAQSGPVPVSDRWLIEVTDVRVDDLDKLRELEPDMAGPGAGEAFLWLELEVTNTGDFADWPDSFDDDWVITAADGITRYDESGLGTCRNYPSPLIDRRLVDPPMEAGETLVLAHCWKVAPEHVEGATLVVSLVGDEATFDLGL